MRTLLTATLLVAVAVTPAAPVKLSKAAAEAVVKDIQQERAKAEAWLKSDPTSYLAAVARQDFGEKTALTVGRAPDNDVRLDDPAVSAHHLRVAVEGDRFRVTALDRGAGFKVGDASKTEAVVGPSAISLARYTLRLSHQGFPAIIVFDPQSPHFKVYKGLKYFPVDLAYRFELPLTPNPSPETVVIMSTRGNRRRAQRVGWFEFLVGGQPCRLEATRLLEPGVGEEAVSVFFRDATSGKETYPLGRYVDAVKQENGTYLLDFNLAYNPACAFSEYYNCPIPPKGNALAVAIRAGELDAHYH